MSNAHIIFEYQGHRYTYDGKLPEEVMDALPDDVFDEEGFWRDGYPDELEAQMHDDEDTLPSARWEIEHIGGRVLEVIGARENGAIHFDDWKRQIVY